MKTQLYLPFFVSSKLPVPIAVTGNITATCYSFGKKIGVVQKSFELKTTIHREIQDRVTIEIEDNDLIDAEVSIDISVTVSKQNIMVNFVKPEVAKQQNFEVGILNKEQCGTDIKNSDPRWIDFPLVDQQQAYFKFDTVLRETLDSMVTNEVETYQPAMIYVEKPGNKPNLTIEENIEYYLGKDTVKNLFFKAELPPANEIPIRPFSKFAETRVNTTIIGAFNGDTTEYTYNNLGYRSTTNYNNSELVNKRLIVCFGDSDTFGIGTEYNELWTTKLQQQFPTHTVLNFAVPGISNDAITRIATRAISVLGSSIDVCCVQYAPMSLREFVSKNYKCGVHTHRNYNLPYHDWWDHIDWQSNNYNFVKNKLLIENTCLSNNIRYFDLVINKADNKVPYDSVEFGVYSSMGKHTHRAVANYFAKLINNQPSLFESTQS